MSNEYRVFFSEEDNKWVGTSTADAYRFLSFLAETPEAAMLGIAKLVRCAEEIKDDE